MCAKRRLKSACASVQSDQSRRCLHEEALHPWLSKMNQVKTLIRCANAQADLNLHWVHVSESTLPDVAVRYLKR